MTDTTTTDTDNQGDDTDATAVRHYLLEAHESCGEATVIGLPLDPDDYRRLTLRIALEQAREHGGIWFEISNVCRAGGFFELEARASGIWVSMDSFVRRIERELGKIQEVAN